MIGAHILKLLLSKTSTEIFDELQRSHIGMWYVEMLIRRQKKTVYPIVQSNLSYISI